MISLSILFNCSSFSQSDNKNIEIEEEQYFLFEIGESYFRQTLEYDSNIRYKDNIEIYKIFAHYSMSKEFIPIISKFNVDINYYNRNISGRFKIIIISSRRELEKMEKVIDFDNSLQYLDDDFFDNNSLGIVFVITTGWTFLKNESVYNKNDHLTFSVEVWNQETDTLILLANLNMIFIKIPK